MIKEEVQKMSQTFEKRKKVIYDLICDDLYVPMKFRELAWRRWRQMERSVCRSGEGTVKVKQSI